MKISMLMENTPFSEGFLSEHGLSIHIETEKQRILFDMGQSDGFIANADQSAEAYIDNVKIEPIP